MFFLYITKKAILGPISEKVCQSTWKSTIQGLFKPALDYIISNYDYYDRMQVSSVY